MSSHLTAVPGVIRASRLVAREKPCPGIGFSFERLRGRLVEIVVEPGTPSLSIVSLLVAEAQHNGCAVVWLAAGASRFYPPDFLENGVAIDALPVVDAGNRERAIRTAGHLVRAGVFGLLVVDLDDPGELKPGRLGTLNRLAELNRTAVLFLNRCPEGGGSMGSLISLRIAISLDHRGLNEFVCTICALKDRQAPSGWKQEVVCRGTDGLY